MAQFGEILAELRQDSGMTQKELAQKLHVTTGTISNYENNVHFPDVEKLVDLSKLFNVTTDYLLGLCVSTLSPDVLNRKLLADKTAGSIIQDIIKMTPDRKQALATILNDMSLHTMLEQYGEKKI